jgi:hypothetical protein
MPHITTAAAWSVLVLSGIQGHVLHFWHELPGRIDGPLIVRPAQTIRLLWD